jgi:hypothetical protein
MTENDADGVPAREGEELPDQDAHDKVGQIHGEAHEPDEYQVDQNEEKRVQERPEEAEKRTLVALLDIAAHEVGDEFMPLE